MSERNEMILQYLGYAKTQAKHWETIYPNLRVEMMSLAYLGLVKALNMRIPENPKGYIARVIENVIVDYMGYRQIIRMSVEEYTKRIKNDEEIPTVWFFEDIPGYIDLRITKDPPVWKVMQAKDVCKLLNLTKREHRIIELKLENYTNDEIGLEFNLDEREIRRILGVLKGRYLSLLHHHRGLLRP